MSLGYLCFFQRFRQCRRPVQTDPTFMWQNLSKSQAKSKLFTWAFTYRYMYLPDVSIWLHCSTVDWKLNYFVFSYTNDAPELYQRKLGDLAFLVQNYEFAYNCYHTAKRDFNHEHAWFYFAGALVRKTFITIWVDCIIFTQLNGTMFMKFLVYLMQHLFEGNIFFQNHIS